MRPPTIRVPSPRAERGPALNETGATTHGRTGSAGRRDHGPGTDGHSYRPDGERGAYPRGPRDAAPRTDGTGPWPHGLRYHGTGPCRSSQQHRRTCLWRTTPWPCPAVSPAGPGRDHGIAARPGPADVGKPDAGTGAARHRRPARSDTGGRFRLVPDP